MTNMIIAIVMGVLLLLALLTIIYLIFSKRRKKVIEDIKNSARKERQQIIGSGYKEINDLKKELKNEKQELMNYITSERERIEIDKDKIQRFREGSLIKEAKIENKQEELNKLEVILLEKNDKLIKQLEEVSCMSKEKAKELLFKSVELKITNELSSYVREQELNTYKSAKEQASNILLDAMENYWTDIVNQRVVTSVEVDDDLKGRVIGKEGRNIKAFEQYGGVDIIVDDTPNTITVSSFNPIRREIAVRALQTLLLDGRIQPVRIESELKKQEDLLNDHIFEIGKETIEELEIYNMDVELVKLIGKLKFRSSYTQNVLSHSIEVAKIAKRIALELGEDYKMATRAGLLHDIGKAIDFEEDGTHVSLGVEAAKKYGENEIVVNAIASHHEDVPKESVIATIVAIADGISASRPGARNNQLEDFIKRIQEIENICNSIPGVIRSFAVQSGRQVRVIIDPVKIDEYQMVDLIKEIKDKIKEKVSMPGEITLTVIRETRKTETI